MKSNAARSSALRAVRTAAVLLTLLILPITGRSSAAQDAQKTSLTLDEVLRAVERANPALEAARLEAEALGHRRDQVAALPDPTIGVAYQPFPMLTAHGAQRTQWHLEQTIPYPGKLALQGDIADLSAAVATHEAGILEADLLLQAKEAYFDLFRSQQVTELLRAFQEDLRGFEEAATVRYEVGQGTQQAVLKAQVEKHRVSRQLMELQADQRSAAETLARLTNNREGVRRFDTADLLPPPVPDLQLDALVAVSMAERAELAALDAAGTRAEKQIALARKEFLPDFGVNVTYFDIAAADEPPSATGRDALAVGASVRVPLQRGRIRARLEEAKVHARQIDARREALRTDIETRLRDLLYTFERERATLDLYDRTLLPQAATTVESTLSAYTTGRTDFLDLLDAERTLFSLRTDRADALNSYLKTAARLERVLGVTSLGELEYLITERRVSVRPTTEHPVPTRIDEAE